MGDFLKKMQSSTKKFFADEEIDDSASVESESADLPSRYEKLKNQNALYKKKLNGQ